MPEQARQPMIDQTNRPSPIDFTASMSSLKVGEYLALNWGEWLKVEKEISKELHKPEKELHKVEKEHIKEKELKESHVKEIKPEWIKTEGLKVEKEVVKELVKPEGLKGEKEFKPDPGLERLVDQVAQRVVEVLKQQGIVK